MSHQGFCDLAGEREADVRTGRLRGEPIACRLIPLGAAMLVLAGCARTYVLPDRIPQAYYQTTPPLHDISAEIERIFRAVKRVQVTGVYRGYRFALADSITDADLTDRATYARATERYEFDHSKGGTAAVISTDGSSVFLLTNEHVVELPDTVVVHYPDTVARSVGRRGPAHVESAAILARRSDIVLDLSGTRTFSVLATDIDMDLAALQVQSSVREPISNINVLRVPWGDPARLSWASFVYVLGYPGGYKMVTRAIVSDPNRSPDHGFLLDGLFNRGISGGLILGIRAESGALEWLGMASSASADIEYVMFPEHRDIEEEGMRMPYEGPLYLERSARVRYGITFSVPVTAVRAFLRSAGFSRTTVLPIGSG